MNASATRMGQEAGRSAASKPQLHVLLVEGDSADRDLILRELAKGEFEITSEVVQTAEEFRQRIRTRCPDVVLSDYNLGQWRGTEALEILREEGLDIPLILVSGALGDVTAVECIKQGVTDYVLKDSLARLSVALRGALKDKKARRTPTRARIVGPEGRGTGPVKPRSGTVRLRCLSRLAGAAAHGGGLHPAAGGTLSRKTRRSGRQVHQLRSGRR
jgi:CheY-like chemotaxis protein